MRLTIADRSSRPQQVASWPLPLETPFVNSEELDQLVRDLRRYSKGEIRGRSYLIAGHRGAGKTALTVRAIETVASDMLRRSVKESESGLPDGPFQRPLLVKLHGPSMLEAPPLPLAANVEAGDQAPAEAAEGAAEGPGAAADEKRASKLKGADEAKPPAVQPGVHAALVQMTIGLYRALAGEVATGYRAHALEREKLRPGDGIEMAAQLGLNLDSGAEPAMLRRYWAALRRLRLGVLWPLTADPTLEKHEMTDQGLREVTAVATAGQAFQVCSGRIEYTTSSKETLAAKETIELKGSTNFREALGRLATLGLGAATGVAASAAGAGTAGAIVSGGALWFLGTLSLNWSKSRTRTDDRSVDYSFIRDLAPATLDRDLPVVIQRVRDAGLAPVFVIDELDKVSGAADAIALLVGRLKHLIADFGFFCFLVNRDCYEAIEKRVQAYAYPPEHTLFSERLLLRPYPAEMLSFLVDQLAFEKDDPQADLARAVFALGTMHQSRLNLTDLARIMARSGPGGTLGMSADIVKQRRLILASVQIAIDQVIRSPDLRDRMAENPSFAQLAVDTLYYPSRRWSEGATLVDPSTEALEAYLKNRLRTHEGKEADAPSISPADLDVLQEHLVNLLTFLADIRSLEAATGEEPAISAGQSAIGVELKLSQIPPQDVACICKPLADGRFQFLFTSEGEPALGRAGRMTEDRRRRGRFLLDYVKGLIELLALAGVTLDELAMTPLLNSNFSSTIESARAAVEAAMRRGVYDREVEQYFAALENLHAQVDRNRNALDALLRLVRSIQRDRDIGSGVLRKIERLIDFSLPPTSWMVGGFPRPGSFPATVEEMGPWRQGFLDRLLAAPGGDLRPTAAEYQLLAGPLQRHFLAVKGGTYRPDYASVLAAAAGQLPAAALTTRLSHMRLRDWSRLVVAAMPGRTRPAEAPYWVLIAALRGLGFGRGALLELADAQLAPDLAEAKWQTKNDSMTEAECFELARAFAANASDRLQGLLIVESGPHTFGFERPHERRPLLLIDAQEHDELIVPLQWLSALAIFEGLADARTQES